MRVIQKFWLLLAVLVVIFPTTQTIANEATINVVKAKILLHKPTAGEPLYSWSDNYYYSDNDASNIYTAWQWKTDTISSWEQFVAQRLMIAFDGQISVGTTVNTSDFTLSRMYDIVDKISDDQATTNLSFVSQYFVDAKNYTIVILKLWHDDTNIYFQWNAYFKGNDYNYINIVINNISLHNYGNHSEALPENILNYRFADEYYYSSENHSTVMLAYNFAAQGKTWQDLITDFPYLYCRSSMTAGISGDNRYKNIIDFFEFTNKITVDKSTSLQITVPYFETAGRYTNLILTLWHSDICIYMQWDAYFKGNVTNTIILNLYTMLFYKYAETLI